MLCVIGGQAFCDRAYWPEIHAQMGPGAVSSTDVLVVQNFLRSFCKSIRVLMHMERTKCKRMLLCR